MANSRPKVIACLSGLPLPFVAVALPTERTTFGHGVKTNELPRPLRPSLRESGVQWGARARSGSSFHFNLSVCAESPPFSQICCQNSTGRWPYSLLRELVLPSSLPLPPGLLCCRTLLWCVSLKLTKGRPRPRGEKRRLEERR